MILYPMQEQLIFGSVTEALVLGRAAKQRAASALLAVEDVAVAPSASVQKVLQQIHAAASGAQEKGRGDVAELLGRVAHSMETGRNSEEVFSAIGAAREANRISGGDFQVTRALLAASKLENVKAGQAAFEENTQGQTRDDAAALAQATERLSKLYPVRMDTGAAVEPNMQSLPAKAQATKLQRS